MSRYRLEYFINGDKFMFYFSEDGNVGDRAAELAETWMTDEGRSECEFENKIRVRECEDEIDKLKRHGKSFTLTLKKVSAVLSNGKIVSAQYYQSPYK